MELTDRIDQLEFVNAVVVQDKKSTDPDSLLSRVRFENLFDFLEQFPIFLELAPNAGSLQRCVTLLIIEYVRGQVSVFRDPETGGSGWHVLKDSLLDIIKRNEQRYALELMERFPEGFKKIEDAYNVEPEDDEGS
jgi:hypothetical protein